MATEPIVTTQCAGYALLPRNFPCVYSQCLLTIINVCSLSMFAPQYEYAMLCLLHTCVILFFRVDCVHIELLIVLAVTTDVSD